MSGPVARYHYTVWRNREGDCPSIYDESRLKANIPLTTELEYDRPLRLKSSSWCMDAGD